MFSFNMLKRRKPGGLVVSKFYEGNHRELREKINAGLKNEKEEFALWTLYYDKNEEYRRSSAAADNYAISL